MRTSLLTFLCLFFCVICTLSSVYSFKLSSLPIDTDFSGFPIAGDIELSEKLTFSNTDKMSIKILYNKPEDTLPDSTLKISFLESFEGQQLASIVIPVKSHTTESQEVTIEWLAPLDPEHTKMVIFGFLQFDNEHAKPNISSLRISLTYHYTTDDVYEVSTVDLNVYQKLAHMAHFNTTCDQPREECLISPYTASIQDIKEDLSEIQFRVIGASTIDVAENVENTLHCHINNIPINGTIIDDKINPPWYSFKHHFIKGYDYVINCPESAFINPFIHQTWSLAGIIGIGISHNTEPIKYANINLFEFSYDMYVPQMTSSSSAISMKGTDYVFTRFVIHADEKAPAPKKASIQFEYSGVKIKSVTPVVRTIGNELIQLDKITPNAGYEYQFIDFTPYITHKDIFITLIGEVDQKHDYSLQMIQSRIELKYESQPPAGHEPQTVTSTVIADIDVLLNLTKDEYIELGKDNSTEAFDVPIKLRRLDMSPNKSTIIYRFTNPQLSFDAKTGDIVKCVYGTIQLPQIELTTDPFGNFNPLIWSNIDLTKIADDNDIVFKCDSKIKLSKNAFAADVSLSVSYLDPSDATIYHKQSAHIVVATHSSHIKPAKKGFSVYGTIFVIFLTLCLVVGVIAGVWLVRRTRAAKRRDNDHLLLGETGGYQNLN